MKYFCTKKHQTKFYTLCQYENIKQNNIMIEQAKPTYSVLENDFEKETQVIEDQGKKQIHVFL